MLKNAFDYMVNSSFYYIIGLIDTNEAIFKAGRQIKNIQKLCIVIILV